ncbi:o-succinylbenzoate synthase [Ktedonospora formicarum]|uniref:o-succinylbenzoate synthase n=1 Tax=Ktedonospora formicarum TaxID=2778364 RepID=A0A8J3HYG4_9CHLR|nr:o-succinylbenzoate synthase [Ktedonospora formicarum]GHO43328.1 L-Ala-D/L-Glu epimerase [Ktedonospora formicarum]
MQVQSISYTPYRIPMQGHFSTAHGSIISREGCLIEIMTSGGIIGLGEAAPLPDFGGVSFSETYNALVSLLPQIQSLSCQEALEVLYAHVEAGSYPAPALYGLESALLDAWSQHEGVSLHTLLAPFETETRSRIEVNAVVGAPNDDVACQEAREAIQAGFRCVKLKMGLYGSPRQEIERVATLRAAIGEEVRLRLDANEKWTFEQACEILTACAQYDIQYVEQPLRAFDLDGMYRLRREVQIPIAADEAIYDSKSVRRVLEWQAADVLIIKPQFLGGLYPARQVIQSAKEAGVECVITSMLETGISLSATLHLAAASSEITMACGLATLAHLEDDLLSVDLPLQAGTLSVPTTPGLGIQLDRTALARYSFVPQSEVAL